MKPPTEENGKGLRLTPKSSSKNKDPKGSFLISVRLVAANRRKFPENGNRGKNLTVGRTGEKLKKILKSFDLGVDK